MATAVLERIRKTLNTPRHLLWVIVGDWIFCSLAYWLIERHQEGGPTGPISGLWWGIVTASTVGYGDYSPATTPGRFFGGFLIVTMWALTLIAAAHLAARAVEDNSPAAFTADEQDRMFDKLDAILGITAKPEGPTKRVTIELAIRASIPEDADLTHLAVASRNLVVPLMQGRVVTDDEGEAVGYPTTLVPSHHLTLQSRITEGDYTLHDEPYPMSERINKKETQ